VKAIPLLLLDLDHFKWGPYLKNKQTNKIEKTRLRPFNSVLHYTTDSIDPQSVIIRVYTICRMGQSRFEVIWCFIRTWSQAVKIHRKPFPFNAESEAYFNVLLQYEVDNDENRQGNCKTSSFNWTDKSVTHHIKGCYKWVVFCPITNKYCCPHRLCAN